LDRQRVGPAELSAEDVVLVRRAMKMGPRCYPRTPAERFAQHLWTVRELGYDPDEDGTSRPEACWALWRARGGTLSVYEDDVQAAITRAARYARDLLGYEWVEGTPYESADVRAPVQVHVPVLVEEVDDPYAETWDWLGGYVPKLQAVVETYLESPDPDARLKAYNKLDKYRRKKADGPYQATEVSRYDDSDGKPIPKATDRRKEALGRYDELRFGKRGVRGKDQRAPVKYTYADGKQEWTVLANDEGAIREFMEAESKQRGWNLTDLVVPFRPGRLSPVEKQRYENLAVVVIAAVERGARQEAIGAVIGRDKRRVNELARFTAKAA
jgi:hypothetical protein